EPHDAARRVPAAVLPALHSDRAHGHASRRRTRADGVQRAARRVDIGRIHVGGAARNRRDGVHRRLLVPTLLREAVPAVDQGRHRRHRVLLLHVLVGRAAARAHAHVGRRQADCRDHDAHRVGSRHGLGNARRRRRADDRAGRAGDLLRAPLHRQGFRDGESVMSLLSWMAWTPPVAIFFVCVGLLLVGMTAWELRSPTVARRGLLPLVTTRGDRLFIGLLAAAYVNLAWAGLTDLPQWWGAGLSAVTLVAIMRYA